MFEAVPSIQNSHCGRMLLGQLHIAVGQLHIAVGQLHIAAGQLYIAIDGDIL